MDRQQQGADGEDDFLERIRRAAARTPVDAAAPIPAPPRGGSVDTAVGPAPRTPSPLVSTQTAEALRDLERRIAGLEQQVRRLNDDRARVVSDVADAVVAKLDARWARALGEGAAPD